MLLNIILGGCALIYLMFCYVVVYVVAESMKKGDIEKYGVVWMSTDSTITMYYVFAVVLAPILAFVMFVVYFGNKLLKKVE